MLGMLFAVVFLTMERNAVAGEVRVGDTETRVREVLGPPTGLLETEAFTLLMFNRGTVRIEEGRAVRVQLVSEEVARKQAHRHNVQWAHAMRVAAERDAAERLAMAREREEKARQREEQARERQFRALEERVRRAEEKAERAEREAAYSRRSHYYVHPAYAYPTVTPVVAYPVYQTSGGSGFNIRYDSGGRPAGSRIEAVFGHHAPMSTPGFRGR